MTTAMLKLTYHKVRPIEAMLLTSTHLFIAHPTQMYTGTRGTRYACTPVLGALSFDPGQRGRRRVEMLLEHEQQCCAGMPFRRLLQDVTLRDTRLSLNAAILLQ
jgi:hypothetical protein